MVAFARHQSTHTSKLHPHSGIKPSFGIFGVCRSSGHRPQPLVHLISFAFILHPNHLDAKLFEHLQPRAQAESTGLHCPNYTLSLARLVHCSVSSVFAILHRNVAPHLSSHPGPPHLQLLAPLPCHRHLLAPPPPSPTTTPVLIRPPCL